MITSIFLMLSSSRMILAAERTLERESRETGMYVTSIEGLMLWMAEMVGLIFGRERPKRSMVDGEPWAREMAVSAPTPPLLGPVMRKVRPFTWFWKSETMV